MKELKLPGQGWPRCPKKGELEIHTPQSQINSRVMGHQTVLVGRDDRFPFANKEQVGNDRMVNSDLRYLYLLENRLLLAGPHSCIGLRECDVL